MMKTKIVKAKKVREGDRLVGLGDTNVVTVIPNNTFGVGYIDIEFHDVEGDSSFLTVPGDFRIQVGRRDK